MEGGEAVSEVCRLCLKIEAKYTCPRCNVRYCSLDCYKSEKHVQCSESFYKDCVMEGLKDHTSGPEGKKKIMEMISRVEKENEILDPDDVDEPDLAERLEGLDLDSDTNAIWERLTEAEKKEFEQMTRDGSMGHLVEIWTPWWTPENRQLIEEKDEGQLMQPKKSKFPKMEENIADLSVLLPKSKPSSGVKYSVLVCLYAYSYVCRLHNGGHWDTPIDSAQKILSISHMNNRELLYNSPGEAIQSCIQRLSKNLCSDTGSARFNVSIMEDIVNIIRGPCKERPLEYLTLALSEMLHILHQAKRIISKEKFQYKGDKSVKKKELFTSEKKMEFFLSWSQRYGMSLHAMIPELVLEHSAAKADLEDVERKRKELEEHWGGKHKPCQNRLIEELS